MHIEKIIPGIILLTLLLLLLSGSFVLMLALQRQKQLRHKKVLERINLEYQKNILSAKLDAHEGTLDMISEELHDNLSSILSMINMKLKTVLRQTDETKSRRILNDAIRMQSLAVREMRNLSHILNSEMVSRLGLVGAIEKELSYIRSLSGIEAFFISPRSNHQLNTRDEVFIFRIFHNAVANILKHAGASRIMVEWRCLSPSEYTLKVADNGRGFDKHIFSGPKGMGWLIMQEKASLLHASLYIHSEQGKGSVLILSKSGACTQTPLL